MRPSSTKRNSYPDVYCQLLFALLQKLTTSTSLLAAQSGLKLVCRSLAAVSLSCTPYDSEVCWPRSLTKVLVLFSRFTNPSRVGLSTTLSKLSGPGYANGSRRLASVSPVSLTVPLGR